MHGKAHSPAVPAAEKARCQPPPEATARQMTLTPPQPGLHPRPDPEASGPAHSTYWPTGGKPATSWLVVDHPDEVGFGRVVEDQRQDAPVHAGRLPASISNGGSQRAPAAAPAGAIRFRPKDKQPVIVRPAGLGADGLGLGLDDGSPSLPHLRSMAWRGVSPAGSCRPAPSMVGEGLFLPPQHGRRPSTTKVAEGVASGSGRSIAAGVHRIAYSSRKRRIAGAGVAYHQVPPFHQHRLLAQLDDVIGG